MTVIVHDKRTVIERIRDITAAAIEQKKKLAHARAEKRYHSIIADIEKAASNARTLLIFRRLLAQERIMANIPNFSS